MNRTGPSPFWKSAGGILLALLLAGGLAFTAHSVRKSWRLGDWSDASRQWEVCQYAKARVNPYELAFRLLRETFGPAVGPERIRLKEHRIYSVSTAQWRDQPGVLPGHPPPEATYPPSSLAMLMPTIGWLPKPALLPLVSAVNLACLLLLIATFAAWFRRETSWSPAMAAGLAAALCLLWSPLQFAIENGQFGVLVLLCAWSAIARLDRAPRLAGLLFMVALVKPSLVLLFFFVPLVRWQWKPIWTAFLLGLLLTALPALWLQVWPWTLLAQWLGLCRYLLQGAFTLQEVLNALGWENTTRGVLVVLGVWSAVLAWCVAHRRARNAELFAFLALANLSWTYHERPDFTLLVFLPILFAAQLADASRRRIALPGLILSLVLGLALNDVFYVPDAAWAQAMRWAGRLSLPGLWFLAAAAVRRSHREQPAPAPIAGSPA